MERLKFMKEQLISAVQSQMENLQNVDAEELGEVIDMIKDLEETIYYATITKTMNEKGADHHYYTERVVYPQPMMMEGKYYGDGNERYMPNRNYMCREYDRKYPKNEGTSGGSRDFNEKSVYAPEMRDSREGRSPISRKTYMESKEMHKDKATSLKELETYMNELSKDIVEMIQDASPEEQQYLEKKISQLASKIGHIN